jgi:integrase
LSDEEETLMAQVVQRTWRSGPRKVKRAAWGYTLQVGEKQERKYDATWSRDDAEKALAARLLKLDEPPTIAPPPPLTLAEGIDKFLAFKRVEGKRSVDEDERHLAKLKAWFGESTPLSGITAQRIADYSRERAGQTSRLKRLVSPATRNRELAALRHLLRLAVEWGYIDKAPRIRLAREPEGRLRFLSREDAVRLLEACRQSQNPHLYRIVVVALYTGARRGEVRGLTWERVDFARGVLLFSHTKSGRRREVPMNDAVYRALAEIPGPKREGPVFRRRDGAAWGSIRTAFERAVATAKLDDFRFHDLRHTCASWLVMAGRNLKEVQELLGHRTFAMTLRYAHLSPDRLRDAVASLPSLSTTSARRVESEPERVVSPRRAVSSDGRAPDF